MLENKKALCSDIYEEEIDSSIKTLKRFREVWLKASFYSHDELFQYADDDFYFYRFAVDREERSRIIFLNNILYRVMERYNLDFEVPEDRKNAPFDFIINNGTERLGYTFEDFYADEDINELLKSYDLSRVYIIRTVKTHENSHMIRSNNMYKEQGINACEISIKTFFEENFSVEEYIEFEKDITIYISQSRNIMGYQSIKVLSAMNFSARKLFEEKILHDWDYENPRYQIIDSCNHKIQNILYVGKLNLGDGWKLIRENYIKKELFRAMIGCENYAESFITSEWLYYSLKGKENFDYTSIVSGYLKSIEQLLYKLVMLNVNNGCVISLKSDRDTKNKVKSNGIIVYDVKWDNKAKMINRIKIQLGKDKWPQHPYIDFTDNQKEFMDNSIGVFEFFLRNNPEIFIDSKLAKPICDMVSCFRTECRNGYFHTHNLHDRDIVDKTRENAILLYAILLGSIKKSVDNKLELGIVKEDRFDSICKEIRELRHYRPNFIFEYEDGSEKKMIYDSINNTPEYTDSGVEHYESLTFFEVDDFSMETYEKLDTPIREEWKRLLTMENLPVRIYCYDVNKKIHEVTPELLQ